MSYEDEDNVWARVCSLLFLEPDVFPKYWAAVMKGTFLAKFNGFRLFATKNGGRAFYFQNVCAGTSLVAFCPINSMKNWKGTALGWTLVPCKKNRGSLVLAGVQNVLEAVPEGCENSLYTELDLCLTEDECKRKVFIGMSFGGALASVYAAHFQPDTLVTIGALRIGDENLVHHVRDHTPHVRCYANPGDPVPRWPPDAACFETIDPGDCKDCPKTEHAKVRCHGHYLGIDFVRMDIACYFHQLFECFRAKPFGYLVEHSH